MARVTEVRLVEPPVPPPDAIAAEFLLMLAIFFDMLEVLVLILDTLTAILEELVLILDTLV